MILPITPKKAKELRINSIPDFVIETVNSLIIKNLRGKVAIVNTKDIVASISKSQNIVEQEIYDNGWLDFEPLFIGAGWKVDYSRPAYDEDWDAHFTFTG